jgi:hypothetical protein
VPLTEPEKRTEKQLLIDAALQFARLRPGRDERAEDTLAVAIGGYLAGNRIISET